MLRNRTKPIKSLHYFEEQMLFSSSVAREYQRKQRTLSVKGYNYEALFLKTGTISEHDNSEHQCRNYRILIRLSSSFFALVPVRACEQKRRSG